MQAADRPQGRRGPVDPGCRRWRPHPDSAGKALVIELDATASRPLDAYRLTYHTVGEAS